MDNKNVTNEENRSKPDRYTANAEIHKTEDHILRIIERVSTVNPQSKERRLKE